MGGLSTILSSASQEAVDKYNIAAAVALHPVSIPFKQPKVPIFYGSGSDDKIVPPEGVFTAYEWTLAPGRVFAEIKGATHLEPNTLGGKNRWTKYVINMFNCHIKDSESDCKKIYGQGLFDNLCHDLKVPMTSCHNTHRY